MPPSHCRTGNTQPNWICHRNRVGWSSFIVAVYHDLLVAVPIDRLKFLDESNLLQVQAAKKVRNHKVKMAIIKPVVVENRT